MDGGESEGADCFCYVVSTVVFRFVTDVGARDLRGVEG